MGKDIHKSVFDEGTLTKLEILREYLKSWFPVFIKDHKFVWEKVQIYDFFAGEGSDIAGNKGSPIIILEELRVYCQTIKERQIKVDLVLNEFKQEKYDKLNTIVTGFLSGCKTLGSCPLGNNSECPFNFIVKNEDFHVLFRELYPEMKLSSFIPRFMFLDQNGIKFINQETFSELISLNRTDFLFFISSSFAKRFAEVPEFLEYLKVSKQEFESSKPFDCHRVILQYYKNLIPSDKDYYLAPFSIRKIRSGNIYGLIFGSNSPYGLEKFLKTAWKFDKNTGEANFNIDNDSIISGEISLFPEDNVIKKVQLFQNNMIEFLKDNPRTNKEVYLFTLESGFTPTHAIEILRKLQEINHIKVDLIIGSEKIKKGSFFLQNKPKKEVLIRYE
jgi:three-Cys-motif partner protein